MMDDAPSVFAQRSIRLAERVLLGQSLDPYGRGQWSASDEVGKASLDTAKIQDPGDEKCTPTTRGARAPQSGVDLASSPETLDYPGIGFAYFTHRHLGDKRLEG